MLLIVMTSEIRQCIRLLNLINRTQTRDKFHFVLKNYHAGVQKTYTSYSTYVCMQMFVILPGCCY